MKGNIVAALVLIVVGSALQIFALGSLLFLSSMVVANYERAVRMSLSDSPSWRLAS